MSAAISTAKSTVVVPAEPAGSKGRIYLIDAMSFIFRAYHAMARQRPMSTKTGIPTSATFVFVNMLRKLRADFDAAISGGGLRRGGADLSRHPGSGDAGTAQVRQQDADLVDVAYDGYKANRAAMPDDLAQQVPYIRRALEAYRIPILEAPGFRGR